MAYRETQLVRVRAANRRQTILDAAIRIVATSGFAGANVRDIAAAADVSTGSVYSYFGSRDELLAEVFRVVAGKELEVASAVLLRPDAAFHTRLRSFVLTFAGRALRGRRMAEALLFEPTSPTIEAERLTFRQSHHCLFAEAIVAAVEAGELPPQDSALASRAVIGAIGETLLGRLTKPQYGPDDDKAVSEYVLQFCVRALGAQP